MTLGAACAFALAVAAWVAGVPAGLRTVDRYCGEESSTTLTEHVFPLVSRCTFADGTTRELVPGWVNPIIFLCLSAGVALLTIAIYTAYRRSFVAGWDQNA
jgi:hypothetical protein